MNVNAPVVIVVIIAAFALLIWMVRRDQKDKRSFEKELNDEEAGPEKKDFTGQKTDQ